MFKKILVANRGEIAVRIIRACQEMGIATVAVYSEVDATAVHTTLADEAIQVGPPPPTESYLAGERILAAADEAGCDALHPGYGFLAENAAFAEAVRAAGIAFIGPRAEAVRLMGFKTAARATMRAAGIPIVPGYQERDDDDALIAAGQSIGYPLLVKAVAGGGGKGMRLVEAAAELPEALQAARREATHAFGDGRLYLEKYIAEPRHVEFQIFGDTFGNIVHLFERECSIQRRHQKIIEESPSPFLNDELRTRMGQAAVAAARAVNYTNAGTVEFLVDADKRFYFLEMNTRLQVEHPVTELVTGVDLVKLQIRVAAGEPLPFQQIDLSQRGHALECRIYAEDPANGFSPDTGRLWRVAEPGGPGIRVDSGVTTGDDVTLHYDPLLAKLIVLGDNRRDALQKMSLALQHYVVLGVRTNIPFLRDVVAHPAFQCGETTTDFVPKHFSEWGLSFRKPGDPALIAAALSDLMREQQSSAQERHNGVVDSDRYSPWDRLRRFRVGRSAKNQGR